MEEITNENVFIANHNSEIITNDEREKRNIDLLMEDEKIKKEVDYEMDLTVQSGDPLSENSEHEKTEEYREIIVKEEIGENVQNGLTEFQKTAIARENNYVYQLLMADPEGEFQIAAYDFESDPKNYQQLLDKKRTTYFDKNKVAKKIIFHEFRRSNSYAILHKRLAELAKIAAECFPRLNETSFYYSSMQGKNSGGCLNTFYVKQREKEIAIGRCKSRVTKRKRVEVSESEGGESEDLKKLQEAVEVVDEAYKLKWSTTDFKQKILFYEKSSIDSILETFVNLKGPAGPTLIEADYVELHKAHNNFYENWSEIAPKIIMLAKRKAKKDSAVNAVLRENDLEGTKNIENADVRLTVALILLPYLFKRLTKQTCKSKTGKQWKPPNEEVLKGFIYHTKVTEDLSKELARIQDELKNVHDSHNIQLRPYVVISGPALNKITSAHVVLGKWSYETSSAMKAVDLCFKCSKVFQKPYSMLSNHVWQFLEVAVYKMQTEVYSSVTNVIESLHTVA